MSKFSLTAVFKAGDKFTPVIAKMASRVDRFARGMEHSLGRASKLSDGLHAKLQSVALGAAGLGIAAGAVGKNVIETGANFEAALSSVAAVSGATGAELDKLKSKAMELGASTKFTGAEVVGAMEAMVKAGFKVDETLAGVGGILSAAAADGATIEETASSIMASMKGLGLGPEKMQLFADQLAKAGDSTAASIGTLTESMSKFGPVARQLGVPVESAIAQLALLQDAGIDASSAGTTLAATYSKLAAPVGATKDAIKALGIEVADAQGNMKPPDRLMADIIRATDGIEGNVGKMAAITNLVGLESQKALLNIAAAAKEGKLERLTKDLRGAAGYADVIAGKRLDNFRGDVTKLGAAVDTLKVKLFDTQKGPLRGIAQGMTKWVTANEGLITSKVVEYVESFRTNLPEIVTWTKRIGVGIGVFYGLSLAVKAAQTAIVVYNGIVKTATLLTAGYKWITKSTTLAKGASATATWAQNAAQAVQNTLAGAGSRAMGALGGATAATAGATNAAAVASGRASLAFGSMAAAAGSAAAAVGSVMLAMDQADKLAKETGGLGITGLAGEMWERGTFDPFAAYDAYADEQAIAKAGKRSRSAKASKFEEQHTFGLDPESLAGMAALQHELAGLSTKFDPQVTPIKPRVAPRARPQVVSPAERAATQLLEQNTTHTEQAEVTIKTPPGTSAEITKVPRGKTRLRTQPSGAF